MKIGVPMETARGDRRVALIPDSVAALIKKGFEIIVQSRAGEDAEYPDSAYEQKGAQIAASREEVFQKADILVEVSMLSNPSAVRGADLAMLRKDQAVIGFMNPLGNPGFMKELAGHGVTAFALELLPRITRAQSMDALSSMATCAGYKAVLMAAEALPRFFPMFMTAAGTVTPARVFIVGAGVAGLQAIAIARKLGAVVHAYDVRPAVKQEVESLGGKFVELALDTAQSADSGGYAKAMDETFYAKQREMMHGVIAKSDVVITTAAVPGKKAPVLVTKEMVEAMPSGSVIIDLAAEQGGNCELTEPGETITHNRVKIMGPLNLPSSVAYHASQMYSKNITTFILNLVKDGKLDLDADDEIIRDSMVTRGGQVVHPRVKELLG